MTGYDYAEEPAALALDDMNKKALKALVQSLQEQLGKTAGEASDARQKAYDRDQKLRKLTAEVEQMREHWRPVPVQHEWQPRDPQCALCDDPRDSVRHRPASVADHFCAADCDCKPAAGRRG